MSAPESRRFPEPLPVIYDGQGKQICAVPDPEADSGICGKKHAGRGRCANHYYQALRACRQMHPRLSLGRDPEYFGFGATPELGRRIRSAAEAAGMDLAPWLREAVAAHLPAPISSGEDTSGQ